MNFESFQSASYVYDQALICSGVKISWVLSVSWITACTFMGLSKSFYTISWYVMYHKLSISNLLKVVRSQIVLLHNRNTYTHSSSPPRKLSVDLWCWGLMLVVSQLKYAVLLLEFCLQCSESLNLKDNQILVYSKLIRHKLTTMEWMPQKPICCQ